MTIHWIDNLTLERKSEVLSCQRVLGTHSYDVLTTCMLKALDSISIRSKVKHVISDGGKNFEKAFRVNGAADDPELKKILELQTRIEGMEEQDSLCDILEIMNDSHELPCAANCGSHKLSLISTTDVKKHCEKKFPDYWNLQSSSIKKLTRLWSKQHYSSKFSDEIKSLTDRLFKTACETRWFSTYDAIKDFLDKKKSFPEALNKLFDNHQGKIKKSDGKSEVELPKLKVIEEQFLAEYVEVIIYKIPCKIVKV